MCPEIQRVMVDSTSALRQDARAARYHSRRGHREQVQPDRVAALRVHDLDGLGAGCPERDCRRIVRRGHRRRAAGDDCAADRRRAALRDRSVRTLHLRNLLGLRATQSSSTPQWSLRPAP